MSFKPIAIIGIGGIFPDSLNPGEFWRQLMANKNFMRKIPNSHTHWLHDDYFDSDPKKPEKTHATKASYIPEVAFDPVEFGIPPNAIEVTDTAQLLTLVATKQLLQDAFGDDWKSINLDETCVILGTAVLHLLQEMNSKLQRPYWREALRQIGLDEETVTKACDKIQSLYTPWTEATFPGLLSNVVAGRVCNRFNMRGSNCTVDAACAGSMAAMSIAIDELQLGRSNMAVCGGVDLLNDILMLMCFSKTGALSFENNCRPFSNDADGTMMGEAISLFALKRLDEAERDGDNIYAVIRGIGSSSDGRSKSVYAPIAAGQTLAVKRAYESAGYPFSSLGLIEAHGTATRAGDAAEFQGLVGASQDEKTQHNIAIGSVKSQVGHTKACAAATSVFKVVMALQQKIYPATIKVDTPNQKFDIDETSFYINSRSRPWVNHESYPRRAGVSSFGFGGSNYHMTIEEYTGKGNQPKLHRTFSSELFVVSADNPALLVEQLNALPGQYETYDEWLFSIKQSQINFAADKQARLAIVTSGPEDFHTKVEMALKQLAEGPSDISLPNGIYFSSKSIERKVAFLFPGQGSQYLYMGGDVAMHFPLGLSYWQQTTSLDLPEKLDQVVFPIPVFTEEKWEALTDKLRDTKWSQPALAVTNLMFYKLLQAFGVEPHAVGGHSFGELAALHVAGVVESEEDFINIAIERGKVMAEAAEMSGAMTAVLHPSTEVLPAFDQWEIPVAVANFNSPNQLVFSGALADIEKFEQKLKEAQMDFRRLPTSGAFHHPMIAEAANHFGDIIRKANFKQPHIPVYSNTLGIPYSDRVDEIKEVLSQHMLNPVRFTQQIDAMHRDGVNLFIEVGPSNVLSSLVDTIIEDEDCVAINLDNKKIHGIDSWWHALGRMAVAGLEINFDAAWDDWRKVVDPDTIPKPKFTVKLNAYNYKRPYPPETGIEAITQPNSVQSTSTESTNVVRMQNKKESKPERVVMENRSRSLAPAPQIDVKENVVSEPRKVQQVVTQPAANAQQASSAVAASNTAAVAEVEQVMLRIMAEKTGYPVESLQMDMDLEADLGIDSIKRVEILSTMQEEIADLPALDPAEMSVLQTMGDISNYLSQQLGGATVSVAPSAEPTSAQPAPATQADPVSTSPDSFVAELEAVMLKIVAEKTGYPIESLQSDMDLEADLGIDSIKRVEILSTMQEEVPDLPALDPAEMSVLQTIGDITNYLAQHVDGGVAESTPQPTMTPETNTPSAPTTAQSEPAQSTAPSTPAPSGSVAELEAVMLKIVADKTGYPIESLQSDMDLEADLGIDSIKRVEILSTMQEEVPDLPVLDPAEMSVLQTIGDITNYLAGQVNDSDASAQTSQAPVPVQQTAPAQSSSADESIMTSGSSGRYAGLQSTTITGASPAAEGVIERYAVGLAEAVAPGQPIANLMTGAIEVIADQYGVANKLVEGLKQHNANTQLVQQPSGQANVVIDLEFLQDINDVGQAVALNKQAFKTLKTLAPKFSQQGGSLVVVTTLNGRFGVEGEITPLRAWAAGVSGLVKTAAQEWQQSFARVIDLEIAQQSVEQLAQRLLNELLTGNDQHLEIGLTNDGQRWCTQTKGVTAEPKTPSFLTQQDVIVATGGAKGITANCLIELAKKSPCKFVLLGRTPLSDEPEALQSVISEADLKRVLVEQAQQSNQKPNLSEINKQVQHILGVRTIEDNIAKLRQLGAEVFYVAADTQNQTDLKNALEQARQKFGPITGIVHGAGVLADKLLVDKTEEQFDRVFNTKVVGLFNLLELTQDDPLKLICMFSSVSGRYGNPGQADYACANEVMNKIANFEQQWRGASCQVKAINWGPWDSGMVTPALKKIFSERNIVPLPLDLGSQEFVYELARNDFNNAEVVLGGTFEDSIKKKVIANDDPKSLSVTVDPVKDKVLFDHSVNGQVVIPMVYVIEWFFEYLARYNSDPLQFQLNDLEVVQGVKIGSFSEPEEFTVREDDQGELQLWYKGSKVYKAKYAKLTPPSLSVPFDQSNLKPAPWSIKEAYADPNCFHGPDFHMVCQFYDISEKAGACALLPNFWPNVKQVFDRPLIDGALQFGGFWIYAEIGYPALPMKIRELRIYKNPTITDPIDCVSNVHRIGNLRSRFDMQLRLGDEIFAELAGLELVVFITK